LVPDSFEKQRDTAWISVRIPRKKAVKYDKQRYERHNRIEIVFGRIKVWRRLANRSDWCRKVFLSTIVIYWL